MSSWSNCPSAARLQKIIDERPLGGRAGTKPSENALKNTSAKDLEKTTGNAMKKRSVNALKKRSRNALENGSGYASEETSRNVSGKTSGDALEKETVKPADLDNDNNSSQGVSITNESVDANGGGPKGETEVQRLRRRAGSAIDNDWVLQRDANGQTLKPLTARGMYNSRNVCYRNSVLQCLFHEPTFAQWLRFHHAPNACLIEGCVACAIARLIHLYWSADSKVLQPFKKELRALHRTLNSNGWQGFHTQEDAHDLYLFVARNICQQVNGEYALLSHIFSLRTRRTTYFHCCSQVSTGYDEEYSLVVNVERKRTRPQKLRSLIKAAMKLGVEEMQYPSCDSVVTDLKCRINIQAAPEVLVVLLARFGWDASTQPVDKIHGIVKFGPRLDLSRYYLPNEPLRKQSLRYQLVGVVSHAGNLTGGHYTATVRQPDKGLGSTSPAGKKTKRQSSSDAADASAAEKWKLAHDTRVTD